MKHYLIILYTFIVPNLAIASPESENEPASGQMDILASALSAIQKSGVKELTSQYNKIEKTGYYARESSPPRGHSFVVIFDDSINYLSHRRIEYDSTLKVKDGVLIIDHSTNINLESPKKK